MSPAAAQAKLRTPQQLYEDWERSHWSAREVDLARDGEDWARMEDGERTLLHWVLSSLMVAEERISTQFCGLVLAQDDEEEGSFLSTQLVDEVRHMQFYARFQNEVVADRTQSPGTSSAPGRCWASRSRRCSTRRSWKPTTGCAWIRATARPRSNS